MTEQVIAPVVTSSLGNQGVLEVSICNPPVNALAVNVRRGLLDAIEAADSDPRVLVVVLSGKGANFIGGADIREFGQAPQAPTLSALCNRIEACSKPVLSVLHGATLGGGLEVALASHYRVAFPEARLGLPEVLLGLMPGAGGSLRTPRLIGMKAALDMMLSGRQIFAAEAHTLGLVDRLVDRSEGAQEVILSYALELLASTSETRRSRDAQGLARLDDAKEAIQAAKAEIEKRSRGLFSPSKIVLTVESSIGKSFEEGLTLERAAFLECVNSAQHTALVHAFFAEREVWKVPEAKASSPRQIGSVGVIGGGTMGAGIAVAALDAGFPVVMVERDEGSVERGRFNVEKLYDGQVSKGRMTSAQKIAVMERFSSSTSFAALQDTDLVIEAVFEDIDLKKSVFRQLDLVCKPGTVLATNTSYLDVNAIADSTSRPHDVIGLHFFSPANVMRLLEIVVPSKVGADVVATAFALAKKLGKVPVRAGVCDGFIGNRILAAYRQAIDLAVEDGASPYEVDAAVRDFGYPMGPFQVSDLSGGDIGWATRKRKAATRDSNVRYVQIADRLCERGWLGQKTGRGWYLYPSGTRVGQPDHEVMAIVDDERKRAGITPRSFSRDEILRRFIAAMVNEGANVLEEDIALRPLDIDVTFICGFGFPRFRGGPMKYADTVGLVKILQDICSFSKEDPVFWRPSPLLERLVSEGRKFDDLNQFEKH